MPTPKENCPLCKGLGFIETPNGAKRCQCVYRQFDLNRYLNIPKKFHDAELQHLPQLVNTAIWAYLVDYVDKFEKHFKKGTGLLLVGPTGVGKTYSIIAVLKEIYKKYKIRGLFFDTKELSIRLKSGFSNNTHHKMVSILTKIPVLVLDDLGNEELGEWYREILTGVISYRYNQNKVTLITTNYYPSYVLKIMSNNKGVKVSDFDFLLDKRLGSHTISRIAEMTLPVIIEGRDKRVKKVMR